MNFYCKNYDLQGEKQVSCNSPKMTLGAKDTLCVITANSHILNSIFNQCTFIGIGELETAKL